MATILFVLAAAVVIASPVWVWLNEIRLRKLAEHRLKMAQAVSRAEKLMLSGELKNGEVCHDSVFQFMVRAQFLKKFPAPRFPTRLSKEQQAFRDRLKEELRNGQSPMAEPLDQFLNSYYAGFRLDRPVVSKLYVLLLIFCWCVLRAALEVLRTIRAFQIAWATLNEWETKKSKTIRSVRVAEVPVRQENPMRSFIGFSETTFAASTRSEVMGNRAFA